MSNINDYLVWRGDIPLNDKEFAFNELDSMILARFSYLRFDKIEMLDNENIESVSSKMREFDNDEFLYNGDKELITNLGDSIRFKNMIVTDYEKINDKNIEEQFGAVTVHISKKEMYISYIGTDNTIYGWKEDFNMSFMDSVPCQVLGKGYLEKIAKKYPNKKIRIGGHSKGGNVAIYSAVTVSKKIQDRIIKVYNYDGPGFNQNVFDKYGNDEIIEKIETYIPQDSVIGRIMEHNEKSTIVHSNEKGIFQHDIYSWEVLKDDIVKETENTKISENFNKSLSNWLKNTTVEQRAIFIDSVFELFYATDANTFGEMSRNLKVNIPVIFRKYKEISPEDKKIVIDMIKLFGGSYLSILKDNRKRNSDKYLDS